MAIVNLDGQPIFDKTISSYKQIIDRVGWILLTNLPPDFEGLNFSKKFGRLMPQYNDRLLWDVKIDINAVNSHCSLGSLEVYPHTEFYEGVSNPPNYLALWCLNPAACGGGRISIADSYAFLETLSQNDAKGSGRLADIRATAGRLKGGIRFRPQPLDIPRPSLCARDRLFEERYLYKSEQGLIDLGLGQSNYHPILSQSPLGKKIFRFNLSSMEKGNLEFLASFRQQFMQYYRENNLDFLQPKNSLLIWDNFRMVHSRSTSFTDPKRHLVRFWFEESVSSGRASRAILPV